MCYKLTRKTFKFKTFKKFLSVEISNGLIYQESLRESLTFWCGCVEVGEKNL